MSAERLELNGRVPDPAALAFLAQVNYGHFTTLQVQQRSARGFGLHLQRLGNATRELFGSELDLDRLRDYVRQILTDQPVTLRITVFSRELDRSHMERAVATDVLVATSAAAAPDAVPLRLRSIVHERVLAQMKHVGTFDLWHERRRARLAGFDDALFCTPQGEVAEGSTWNIGFWDGAGVVWPRAPALAGITRHLLDSGLQAAGVASKTVALELNGLGRFRSAFVVNSGSIGPLVDCIDDMPFVVDAELFHLLRTAYLSQPLEPI